MVQTGLTTPARGGGQPAAVRRTAGRTSRARPSSTGRPSSRGLPRTAGPAYVTLKVQTAHRLGFKEVQDNQSPDISRHSPRA